MTDLIDHAGSLPNKAATHPLHGLEIELILGLGGDRLHGRPLDHFGDGLGVAEIVLLPLNIGRIYLAGLGLDL